MPVGRADVVEATKMTVPLGYDEWIYRGTKWKGVLE